MPTINLTTRFWTQTQNNSGGRFDHDSVRGIGYAICVEATDANDAARRLQAVVDSYPATGSCPCCGDRWYIWTDMEDGTEEPTLYGEPLAGGWGLPSYVHHIDGRIEARPEVQA
ncbi:DUF7296 family protein [Sphingomonas melonis]|uniref:DUF7296 domain-containing protein n=1 Tax=Sphingomonas melonis TaxID=152682 RepID=A0A7Y9FKG8_9SPHN|nr:hypothetical protein [Sphingomonas melonis]NYD88783.1 hypothetical protein [Sphingomonas melonis]